MSGYVVCAEYQGKDFTRQRSLKAFDHFLRAHEYAEDLRLEAEECWRTDEHMSTYAGPLQTGETLVIATIGKTGPTWRYSEETDNWLES